CTCLLAALLASSLAQLACAQETTAEPDGRLPSAAPPPVADPVLRPPAGPAEVFQRFGIDAGPRERFVSGEPLSPSEEDLLLKILYHLPRLGLENMARWRQSGVTWEQLAVAPAAHRTDVFRLAGRVKRVEKRNLLPEQAELFEFDHFYAVRLA